MEKAELAVAEYNALRADLLISRSQLQKSLLYTLGLASIVISILGTYFGSAEKGFKSDFLEMALMLAGGIFFLISLNHVSLMRHYVSLSKYLFCISTEIRKEYGDYNLKKIRPVFSWDLWNIRHYNRGISKVVFFFTWGSQPIFSILFAFVSFGIAVFIDESFFFKTHENSLNILNIVLLCAFVFVAILSLFSLCYAVIELFSFIRMSEKFNEIRK